MLWETMGEMPEPLKTSLLMHVLTEADKTHDGQFHILAANLIRNGCPVDVIIRTIDDMIEMDEREKIRDMLGDGFNILFEGEE